MPCLLVPRRLSDACANRASAGLIDAQIAATLEREGYQTPGLVHPITSKIVCHLRARWKIPTVKLNNNQQNPAQWEDGSYSVEGAAAKLDVDQSTIFTWLKTGKLNGEHLGRSMPWKIYLTEEDERRLHEWLRCQGRRARRSKGRHYDVFEEVALLATHLHKHGVLSKISERVRFARRRFGRHEVVDFLAVQIALRHQRGAHPGGFLRETPALCGSLHGVTNSPLAQPSRAF
jgi:hypothetical protein